MASKRFNAREILRQIELELFEDIGETSLAILRNVVAASPVGNPDNWVNPAGAPAGYVGGHFKRNWLVSVGGFNEAEVEGTDSNGATTIAGGQGVIEGHSRGRSKARLVIQNNVPYAGVLAAGGHAVSPPASEPGWIDDQIDAALSVPGGRRDLR